MSKPIKPKGPRRPRPRRAGASVTYTRAQTDRYKSVDERLKKALELRQQWDRLVHEETPGKTYQFKSDRSSDDHWTVTVTDDAIGPPLLGALPDIGNPIGGGGTTSGYRMYAAWLNGSTYVGGYPPPLSQIYGCATNSPHNPPDQLAYPGPTSNNVFYSQIPEGTFTDGWSYQFYGVDLGGSFPVQIEVIYRPTAAAKPATLTDGSLIVDPAFLAAAVRVDNCGGGGGPGGVLLPGDALPPQLPAPPPDPAFPPSLSFSCDCPDFSRRWGRSRSSPYASEQRDRDWTDTAAGCDQEFGCKHIMAVKLRLGVPIR